MAWLPWFELDTDFADGPKVQALASRLREPLADAYIARLYAYCYRHAQDRFDALVASDTIETAARWKGRRGNLFDALFAAEVLEREAGKVVVHGVKERLGPHLAKRVVDAERQKRHRDKAATSIGRPPVVTRDVTDDVTDESRGNTDKDKDPDKDKGSSITSRSSEGGLAGESITLRAFREKLTGALGLPGLISIAKPFEAQSVADFFEAQLAAVGPDWLLRDCLQAAAKANTTPGSLRWLKPWIEKLHTPTKPTEATP